MISAAGEVRAAITRLPPARIGPAAARPADPLTATDCPGSWANGTEQVTALLRS